MLPPSRPSSAGCPSRTGCGLPLLPGRPSPAPPVADGGRTAGVRGACRSPGREPGRCEPRPPVVRELRGSSDCSGATSSSMASKTELTSSPTSVELRRAAGRAARPRSSRWEREKEESVWIGPSEPSRSYAAWSRRWPSEASCCMPVRARRTSPSDSWSRSPGAAALHQAAGLAQPGGGLVEVELAAVGVVVGQAELEVLHAALQAVERVTGQGVGTGSGHSAEGARGHADGEPAGGEALRPAGAGSQFPERGGPVGAPARSRCSGTVGSAAPPAAALRRAWPPWRPRAGLAAPP